ncbi:MAG: hypothetical protein R6V03_01010 [Kiritimatiellia bacterium]
MIKVHPEYVVDEKQNPKSVILPVSEWQRVVEDLEELDDIRTYDKAKAGPQDAIPFEQAVREIREGYDT